MKAKVFFEMLESANDFKALIKEQKTKVSVFCCDVNIGSVCTFEQFDELLGDFFCEEIKKEILSSAVATTIESRAFRISFHHLFDGKSGSIKLFVD